MDREAWGATVPWGHKESDTTEQLTLSLHFHMTPTPQSNPGKRTANFLKLMLSLLQCILLLSGATVQKSSSGLQEFWLTVM